MFGLTGADKADDDDDDEDASAFSFLNLLLAAITDSLFGSDEIGAVDFILVYVFATMGSTGGFMNSSLFNSLYSLDAAFVASISACLASLTSVISL